MADKGQLFGIHLGMVSMYKLLPFVFGIFEFQLNRLDREFVDLFEEYTDTVFGKEFYSHTPALMKVVPIGIDLHDSSAIEPYESVAQLIENARSWAVQNCICKKSRALEGHRCDKPMEVCLAFAPLEEALKAPRISCYGGPLWTVSEPLFESKKFIPALHQLPAGQVWMTG